MNIVTIIFNLFYLIFIRNKTEIIFEEILSPKSNKPKPKENAKVSLKFKTPKLCVDEINESEVITKEKRKKNFNEVKDNIKDLHQNLIYIIEKLISNNEFLNAITTEVNTCCHKTVLYNERMKSRSHKKLESIILWIVFIVFIGMVVYIVWFSEKDMLA